MYSDAFSKVYNEFGWNYFPEAFAEQLWKWIVKNQLTIRTSMDLGCGTGVLAAALRDHGVNASGTDFSESMIRVAKDNYPDMDFQVADMIIFRPERSFDLVTCTGDALNHIIDLKNVEKIFENVYSYLNPGGYFIFDILNSREVSTSEPFDLDFSDTVKAQFQMLLDDNGIITLKTTVYENGQLQFEEKITETLHDPLIICNMLKKSGFDILRLSDQLMDDATAHGTTWFIIARKPE